MTPGKMVSMRPRGMIGEPRRLGLEFHRERLTP
jgi:hypothetical protein